MRMAFKRKRSQSKVPKYLKRPTKRARKTRFAGRAGIARVVKNLINRKIETKESQRQINFIGVGHNNIRVLTDSGTGTPIYWLECFFFKFIENVYVFINESSLWHSSLT